MLRKLIASVAFYSLIGCATTSVPYQSSKNLVPQDSRGAVVVYWHKDNSAKNTFHSIISLDVHELFSLNKLEVLLDDKKLGELSQNTHMVLGVKEGKRNLKIHFLGSTHDSGEVKILNVKVGSELIYEVKTDKQASATTHYVPAYFDSYNNIWEPGGNFPDFYYYSYNFKDIQSMSAEGENSERSLMYIEP